MNKKNSPDFILFFIVSSLVVFGVIMVFSSSYYDALDKQGDAFYFLKKDIVWALLGFFMMYVASRIHYENYRKYSLHITALILLSLLLIFSPLGLELNNSVRWLKLGPITFMPGEFAKFAAIIFSAAFLSAKKNRIKSFKDGILPMVLFLGLFCGLIILQPNLSTSITVAAIIVGIMFVAGLNYLYLVGVISAGALGVSFLILSDREGYWMKRLTTFLNPFADPKGDGWQVVQSILALGSGGLFGVGLGKSIQKTLYLPEPQNDFIFAIIGEELGFVGCTVLIIAYMFLVWRGVHITIKAPDLFSTLLAAGITIMIAVQVLLNIAVVTSSMPPTGIGLPFISWGGNSLVMFMICIGILLNISKYTKKAGD